MTHAISRDAPLSEIFAHGALAFDAYLNSGSPVSLTACIERIENMTGTMRNYRDVPEHQRIAIRNAMHQIPWLGAKKKSVALPTDVNASDRLRWLMNRMREVGAVPNPVRINCRDLCKQMSEHLVSGPRSQTAA